MTVVESQSLVRKKSEKEQEMFTKTSAILSWTIVMESVVWNI